MSDIEDRIRADLHQLAAASQPPPDLIDRVKTATVEAPPDDIPRSRQYRSWLTPIAAAAVIAAIGLVVALARPGQHHVAPGSSRTTVGTIEPPSTSDPYDLGTVSFCLGTSAQFRTGDVVEIHFQRNGKDLAAPTIKVPMRVSAVLPPGPIDVIVADVKRLSLIVYTGGTSGGAIGAGCPSG